MSHAAPDPPQRQCPLCSTYIQRTVAGILADGMRAHYRVVHPGQPAPRG